MAFKDIKGKMFLLRGQVVMLDYNLAELYGITPNSPCVTVVEIYCKI